MTTRQLNDEDLFTNHKILKLKLFLINILLGCLMSVAIFLSGQHYSNIRSDRPHARACWLEPKTGTGLQPERICGDVSKAPSNAIDFTDFTDSHAQ